MAKTNTLKEYHEKYPTFNVKMDRETIRDIIEVLEYVRKYPAQKNTLWKFKSKIESIIRHGCFKHSLIGETFRISLNESCVLCPKCSPKRYKELKLKEK